MGTNSKNSKTKKKKETLTRSNIIIMLIILAVVALAIWIIIDAIYASKYGKSNSNEPESVSVISTEGTAVNESAPDYSAFLTDDGLIKDLKVSDYVDLADIDSITVSAKDIEPSSEDISKALESYYQTDLLTDASLEIKDGDTVNIDYVGYVDDKAFEGGDTKGNGTQLTIGSGRYIDDFEQQLIGHKPGEDVDVNVTFPADYGKDELNGKDALFKVKINGIYDKHEPTDEYVAEKFSEVAKTYDELKTYVTDTIRSSNKETAVWKQVMADSKVKSYPEDYLKAVYANTEFLYQNEYNYYNQYAYSVSGKYQWNSIYDYYQVDEKKFNEMVDEDAKSQCDFFMIAQKIFEDRGLKLTDEDINACLKTRGYDSESLDKLYESYGKGYIYQSAIGDKVRAYVTDLAKVE
ncbi:MAG: FKBP-type peptidyl-prolyl cis-trans isomerase [Lachnospiraceae bacterium]|nr:FKBP-type peptidyl-prolyl cis-trans isomerase [Lachnospiraceae bacterium]